MKSLIVIFGALCLTFFGVWNVKASSPINKPDTLQEESTAAWYETGTGVVTSASDEWYLDPEIPVNYIPVPGEDEVYMVVDDSGAVTGYRKRTKQADGSWLWSDVNEVSEDVLTPVDGVDNLYKTTDDEGNESYLLYVRNDDDSTYCYVEADENGTPYYDGSDASTIDDLYRQVAKNVYALYNNNGIKMGYAERVKNSEGNYVWKATDAPSVSSLDGITSLSNLQNSQAQNSNSGDENTKTANNGNNKSTDYNSDGSYTITEVQTNTETINGESVMYETTYYYTYDANGNLISTKKGDTVEVSRTSTNYSGNTKVADTSLIQSTLDRELMRVSAEVSFNTSKANEVLSSLNAERASKGLSELTMDTSSDAYKLACIRAADMAIYHATSTNSEMYGTLSDMVSRWGVSASVIPAENVWGTPTKTASEIHSRFQAVDSMRNTRMSTEYSTVAIAIVDTSDGYTYVAEIYLN